MNGLSLPCAGGDFLPALISMKQLCFKGQAESVGESSCLVSFTQGHALIQEGRVSNDCSHLLQRQGSAMIASVPTNGSVVSDKDFYARFVDLRLKLKALGAEIVSVRHSNHWVDVDWFPRGADQHDEPTRSTLFRLVPDFEADNDMNEAVFTRPAVESGMALAS